MKYETSAGGIVITYNGKEPQVLLLKDKNKNWTFPKGLVENGELKEDAAIREVKEEAGIIDLKVLSSLKPIEYLYHWEGELKKKQVFYFLLQSPGKEPLIPQREEGVMDVKWYPLNQALKIIGYKKTNQPLLKEVMNKVNQA